MFAAANTNLIQLFSTYTFENIGNLKGHNGKVCIHLSPMHYLDLDMVKFKSKVYVYSVAL